MDSILKLTNSVTSYSSNEVITKSRISNTIGAQIGFGLITSNALKIGINYFPLGQHKIKTEGFVDGSSEFKDTLKLRVTLVNLYLSIPLNK